MMSMILRVGVVCLSCLIYSTALAQEDAKALGRVFFERGEYELAIQSWRRVQDAQPDATLWIAIAEAQSRLGDLSGEQDSIERYLLANPEAKDRPALQVRLEAIETRLDELGTVPAVPEPQTEAPEPLEVEAVEEAPVADVRNRVCRRKNAILTTTSLAAVAAVSATVMRFVARNKDNSKRRDTIETFSDFAFGVAAVSGVSALVLHLHHRKAKREKENAVTVVPSFSRKHASVHVEFGF